MLNQITTNFDEKKVLLGNFGCWGEVRGSGLNWMMSVHLASLKAGASVQYTTGCLTEIEDLNLKQSLPWVTFYIRWSNIKGLSMVKGWIHLVHLWIRKYFTDDSSVISMTSFVSIFCWFFSKKWRKKLVMVYGWVVHKVLMDP